LAWKAWSPTFDVLGQRVAGTSGVPRSEPPLRLRYRPVDTNAYIGCDLLRYETVPGASENPPWLQDGQSAGCMDTRAAHPGAQTSGRTGEHRLVEILSRFVDVAAKPESRIQVVAVLEVRSTSCAQALRPSPLELPACRSTEAEGVCCGRVPFVARLVKREGQPMRVPGLASGSPVASGDGNALKSGRCQWSTSHPKG
jgi:hypothetical protein